MMVYFMLCLKNNKILFGLLAIFLFVNNAFAIEEDNSIKIYNLNLNKGKVNYLMSCNLEFIFTDEVNKAIKKGIPFIFQVNVRIVEERNFWIDKLVHKAQGVFKLKYKSLRQVYEVVDIHDQKIEFDNISGALKYLSNIKNWALSLSIPNDQGEYKLILNVKLDRKKLPKPLQVDFFSQSWNIESSLIEYPLGILI